jgi:hypothetical protein
MLFLVPSGKTITAAPFRSLCMTVLIAVTVEAFRSIGTAPSAAIARAKGTKSEKTAPSKTRESSFCGQTKQKWIKMTLVA